MSGTGRPYPIPPGAGSNAIGQFIIGISPIGSITPFNYWDTIISQYGNSPILDAIIGDMDMWLDQTNNFDAFYDNIWNIQTAVGKGLDIWGEIVGVTRVLQVPTGDYFGFKGPSGASGEPFGIAPFYSGGSLTTSFALTDNAFRTLIYAKALANISDGSIKSINQILLYLFPNRGNCYVVDGNDMTMEYKFEFALSPVEHAIVSQSGVLPKPTGVLAIVVSP